MSAIPVGQFDYERHHAHRPDGMTGITTEGLTAFQGVVADRPTLLLGTGIILP
jgi:hypothetical protein